MEFVEHKAATLLANCSEDAGGVEDAAALEKLKQEVIEVAKLKSMNSNLKAELERIREDLKVSLLMTR